MSNEDVSNAAASEELTAGDDWGELLQEWQIGQQEPLALILEEIRVMLLPEVLEGGQQEPCQRPKLGQPHWEGSDAEGYQPSGMRAPQMDILRSRS